MANKSLVIGVGGSGQWILTHMKKTFIQIHNAVPDWIRLMSIDLDSNRTQQVAGVKLDANEMMQLKDMPPGALNVLRAPTQYPAYLPWLDTATITTQLTQAHLELAAAGGQFRPIGRLGLFLNDQMILASIQHHIAELNHADPGGNVYVYIIGSTAGGTGGGTFIDVAILTRKAMSMTGAIGKVTGILLLANAFASRPGVANSHARMYSFLLDLFRYQVPVANSDWAYQRPLTAQGAVKYRDRIAYPGIEYAIEAPRLFDGLNFVDRLCRNEAEEQALYNEVADGLYLRADRGSSQAFQSAQDNVQNYMAQAGVKTPVMTYGTFKMMLPANLYAQKFALEQEVQYLEYIARPLERGGLNAGIPTLRADEAGEILGACHPTLPELHGLDLNHKDKVKGTFDRKCGTVERMVDDFLAYTNSTGIGLNTGRPGVVPAFDSLKKDVFAEVKTLNERGSGDYKPRKVLDECNGFENNLNATQAAYYGEGFSGGDENQPGTFRYAYEKVFTHLGQNACNTLDSKMIEYMSRSMNAKDDAQIASRLGMAQAVIAAIHNRLEGTAKKLDAFLKLIDTASKNEPVTSAMADLSGCAKTNGDKNTSGIWKVYNPNSLEADAREAFRVRGDENRRERIIRGFQERVLVSLADRASAWKREIDRWANELFGSESGAVTRARDEREQVRNQLQSLAGVASSSIGLPNPSKPGDLTMEGYEEVLRTESTRDPNNQDANTGDLKPYAQTWFEQTKWLPTAELNASPMLKLVVTRAEGALEFDGSQGLQDAFRKWMHEHCFELMQTKSILGFLEWCIQRKKTDWFTLGQHLRRKVKPMLESNGKTPQNVQVDQLRLNYTLIYRGIPTGDGTTTHHLGVSDPNAEGNQTLEQGIRVLSGDLGAVNPQDLEVDHKCTDPNVMFLTATQGFDDRMVEEIDGLRSAYLNDFTKSLRDFPTIALYHPFRGSYEAWMILKQRRDAEKTNVQADDLFIPNLVRILEQPKHVWLFVRALAAGVLKFSPAERTWYIANYPGPNPEYLLTSGAVGEDLLTALIRFTMQREEHRSNSTRTLDFQVVYDLVGKAFAEKAAAGQAGGGEQGVVSGAEAARKDLEDRLDEILSNTAKGLLSDRSDGEIDGLKRIFKYYLTIPNITAIWPGEWLAPQRRRGESALEM